jgi:flagellar hook protein FlgE
VAADNIANVSTTGYKSGSIVNQTLVTRQAGTSYSAGGVAGAYRQLSDVQGLLASSTRSTDLAISGKGFFAVSNQPQGGETLYSRDGSFAPNAQGNLVNSSGYYLLARTPGVSDGSLSPVNVNAIAGTAAATTKIAVGANLPAKNTGATGAGKVYTVSAQATDSLGNAQSVSLQFTAQTGGGYQLIIPGAQQGDASGAAYDIPVTFSGDGTLSSASAPDAYIAGTSSGAAPLSVSLDLSGLTQFGSDFVQGFTQSDGARFGQVSGVAVSANGAVTATFSNGQRQTVADIPVATFASPQNLQAVNGNAFRATDASGAATLGVAGQGGSGSVQGNALELSTTDLGTQFASLIVSKSAYQASLKVLTAADELSQSLLNVRA